MRLTYFASSGRIWDRMLWEARLAILVCRLFHVFRRRVLTRPGQSEARPDRTHRFLGFVAGVIGVAYGFCFMRAPKLLPVLVALHVVPAVVLTPHLGSLAVDWAQVASTAAGVDVSVHISGFDVPEISVVDGVDFNRAE